MQSLESSSQDLFFKEQVVQNALIFSTRAPIILNLFHLQSATLSYFSSTFTFYEFLTAEAVYLMWMEKADLKRAWKEASQQLEVPERA